MAVITTNAPEGRSLSLEVWESTVDIANNRKLYGWKLYGSGSASGYVYAGNFYASVGGIQVYSSSSRIQLRNGTTVASGEVWVSHNSNGSKYVEMYCQAGIYAKAVNATASGGFTAVPIPRQANLTGANDFNDEQNGYMTYNNAAGNAVDQLVGGLYWNVNEALAGYRDVDKTAGNYTFSLSEAERNAIRSRMANTNGPTNIIYYLRTLIGGNYYYSTITKNIYITNANPTMGDFKFQDVNAVTKALTGSDDIIIKGKSNVRVYEITANTFKYATKKSVITDGTTSSWSDKFEQTINNFSKNNVGVGVIDSRNNTSPIVTKTFSIFKEYFDLVKKEQSVLRGGNGVGEDTTLVCRGDWWNANFGAVSNTLTATYRYKKSSSDTWINGTSVLNIIKTGNTFEVNQLIKGDTTTGFDIQFSYDIEVTFQDKLSTAKYTLTLIAGSPAIAVIGNKISLGGKADENIDAQVQVKGKPILEYIVTKTW